MMSKTRLPSPGMHMFPYAVLATLVVLFVIVPPVGGYAVTSTNVLNVGQTFATYATLALAFGLLMILGEFDLSLPAQYGLGAMVAVKTGQDSPLLGVAVAVVVALGVGALNGLLVTVGRLNSVTVSLGTYIGVSAVSLMISGNSSVPYTNYDVGLTLNNPIGVFLSQRSLIAIVLFVIAGFVLARTRWGRDVRAAGGDRRAARVAGLRVRTLVVLTFMISAVLATLPGALLGYTLASASPAYGGLGPMLFALTAVLIGGVGMHGGEGTVIGIAAGVLSMAVLRELLAVIAAPAFVSDLVSGLLMLAVAILAAPSLLKGAQGRGWLTPTAPPAADDLLSAPASNVGPQHT